MYYYGTTYSCGQSKTTRKDHVKPGIYLGFSALPVGFSRLVRGERYLTCPESEWMDWMLTLCNVYYGVYNGYNPVWVGGAIMMLINGEGRSLPIHVQL